ncbi:hypothetical protein D3C74_36150 [compost metagenome]
MNKVLLAANECFVEYPKSPMYQGMEPFLKRSHFTALEVQCKTVQGHAWKTLI